MNDQFQTKCAITVAAMARMVNLSRSRFYQLIGTTFPEPSRDENGRPFYDEEQQQICLGVRQRNCGVNGKPILFYARRQNITAQPSRSRTKPYREVQNDHANILEAIRALGLVTVTNKQVAERMKSLYPGGTNGVDEAEIIRSVFVSIQRQNSEQ